MQFPVQFSDLLANREIITMGVLHSNVDHFNFGGSICRFFHKQGRSGVTFLQTMDLFQKPNGIWRDVTIARCDGKKK
jgi:hypothetical protein